MDIQVQELIDRIKKDGVASAERAAAEIKAEAERKAAAVIAEAEREAADLVKAAKAETARLEKSSVDAIQQAGRNLILAFRDSLEREISALVASECAAAYSADMLQTLIPETVKEWVKKPEAESISVLLSPKQLGELEGGLKAALKAEIAQGLELKPDAALSAGFRIGTKDGAAYYDFSAEAVAGLFASYLNPRVAAVLKDAAKSL
jgi:V/A-type H+-transporting ATPase subunit E